VGRDYIKSILGNIEVIIFLGNSTTYIVMKEIRELAVISEVEELLSLVIETYIQTHNFSFLFGLSISSTSQRLMVRCVCQS